MIRKFVNSLFCLKFLLLAGILHAFAQNNQLERKPPKYPSVGRGGNSVIQESSASDKLAPELRVLVGQFTRTRGGGETIENGIGGYTPQQLKEIFDVKSDTRNPQVNIAIEVSPQTTNDELKSAGASVYFRLGDTVYARADPSALENLSKIGAVKTIGLLKSLNVPPQPPAQTKPSFDFPSRGGSETPMPMPVNIFNRQNLTGKDVVVGVIDSGIDWTHLDFIRPDGTSRVLLLWDLTDNSWRESNGRIGTAPPVLGEKNEQLPGTVYTNQQINAALKGTGQVNSLDKIGHGTAVAGTAAGNGRAAGDEISSAAYRGIAPEADLIVVKVGDCESSISSLAPIGAYWAAVQAKELKRPVVLNLSLGSQFSLHDGSSEEEKLLDFISDSVKGLGVPVVVAAGNEGRSNFHAAGRFGPKREGQVDIQSQPIEAAVNQPAVLLGNFSAKDDWGFYFKSTNPIFRDANGKPVGFYFFNQNGKIQFDSETEPADKENVRQFLQTFKFETDGTNDKIVLQLPVGQYLFYGFGATADVKNGRFDLYLPDAGGAGFGEGAEKRFMVSSPGNAANVITVGSFDFRSQWENNGGSISRFNLPDGEISDYSNPGPRRDGMTKPEIVAPGRYTIASLSKFSLPENGGCKASLVSAGDSEKIFVTKSGKHVAWAGTSASTPFVAGVVALMLQKNPNLKADEIKRILVKTASGRTINGRAVNDERLGYGKIEPEAAIKNVLPATKKAAPKRTR